MNGIITALCLVLALFILAFVPPMAQPFTDRYGNVTIMDCAAALTLCAIFAGIAVVIIQRDKQYGSYLTKLFMFALLLRVAIGAVIFGLNGQDFFGGDAWTYDYYGNFQMLAWHGDSSAGAMVQRYIGDGISSGSAWGMIYFIGGLYSVIGRNMLATQFFNAVLGAATAPVIFMCALEVFENTRVAKIAAIAVAFYPSIVLWSSQGLKDGPTVFFIAVCVLATLRLGKRVTPLYLGVLLLALICTLSLRFYVFYMIFVAIAGAFVIGMRSVTSQSLVRQFVVIISLGMAMTYLGVSRYASAQFEQYGSLEKVQRSRNDLAGSAQSGFGRDTDVSTTSGALSAVPIGLIYLFFAPFPWQLGSLRQSLTLPEMAVWYVSFPFLVLGFWFSIRYRLRQMSPILIFTSMLTLGYSILQGNVGTAYRQRSQVLVFYFIFVAVGAVLVKERQEKMREKRKRERSRVRISTLPKKPGDRAVATLTQG
jgi:hypothetical protein